MSRVEELRKELAEQNEKYLDLKYNLETQRQNLDHIKRELAKAEKEEPKFSVWEIGIIPNNTGSYVKMRYTVPSEMSREDAIEIANEKNKGSGGEYWHYAVLPSDYGVRY